jgi:uncharacterized surface protein with fasciclin (FAS1) repeats
MFRYTQKSIATTLGIAIVSTGLFASIATHAQNGTPGSTAPSPVASPVPSVPKIPTNPVKTPAGGKMKNPATPIDTTTTPGGATTTPATTTPGGMTNTGKKPAQARTIADLVRTGKSFTKLAAALKAADLVTTLEGEGPYTVFAPTDAAFAKLPKGTLTNLLKPENQEKLKQLLTYHVVSGAVTSKMLKSGTVDTVEGSKITVKIKGKKVSINKASVLMADVKASNGVIHAIDTVLIPSTKK